jgi:ribosome-associated translation inhibitor RaiA
MKEQQRYPKPTIQGSMAKVTKKELPPAKQKRKPSDKSIESRADRAETLIRLVGNCFDYTSEEKARDCMQQLELAFEKLKRQFNRKY